MIACIKNHILIKMIDKDVVQEKKTAGGILIPGTTIDRGRTRRGKIIKLGPDANKRVEYRLVKLNSDVLAEPPKYELRRFEADAKTDWRAGDIVLVHWYAGTYMDGLTSVDDEGYADVEEYRLITNEEIVGRWTD